MKSGYVNFHMSQRRALFLVVSFSLVALLLNIIVGVSIDSECAQLNSLLNSRYEYSATTRSPVKQDDYYKFDAGISFTLSSDANISLNVDIVMQALETEYTDQVCWNAKKLETFEVAISKSVARTNGLRIGDKIYSKHVVNGTVCEYSVVEILPEATSIRVSQTKNYNKGIIIMGFDEVYVDNISHFNIIFTRTAISELEANASENIIYREDEIALVVKAILPYLIVFLIIAILLVCVQALLLTKGVKHNFKRLASLGFGKKELDKSYKRLVDGIGIASIIISSLISVIIHGLMNLCLTEIVIMAFMILFELIVLFMTVGILNGRLWRK